MEGGCGGAGYSINCPNCGKGISVFKGMHECPLCGKEIKEEYINQTIRQETKKQFKFIWVAVIVVPAIFIALYLMFDRLLK
jgi:predicted amidophosphoribosyltransferase